MLIYVVWNRTLLRRNLGSKGYRQSRNVISHHGSRHTYKREGDIIICTSTRHITDTSTCNITGT